MSDDSKISTDRVQWVVGGFIAIIASGFGFYSTQMNDDVRSNTHNQDTHITVANARQEAMEKSLLKNWDMDDARTEKELEYKLGIEHRITRLEVIEELRQQGLLK
jgi:hypothetical protein